MKKKNVVLFLFVVIVGLAQAYDTGGPIPILNGDFELGTPGPLGTGSSDPDYWGSYGENGWFNDDVPPSKGTKSIKIWWDDTGVWQSYPAGEGEVWDFSAQVQDWSGDTAEITWDPTVVAAFWGRGNLLQWTEFPLESDTMIDDRWYTIYGQDTAPSKTEWVQIQLVVTGWQEGIGGTIYFDNASMWPAGRPYNPTPAIEDVVAASMTTSLSWTNPEPVIEGDPLSIEVKFEQESGGVLDPNFTSPSTGSGIDIETIALSELIPALTLPLADDELFSWQVTVTDPNGGVTEGPIWTFETGDAPPIVDAGPDQYEALDPSPATVDLNGSVIDDGKSPMTTLWTVDDPNNVTITDPIDQITTATISAVGQYTFTLTATDATGAIGDSMTANVYDTPCEAVVADPAVPLFASDVTGPAGVPDCEVTLFDVAALAADWLACLDDRLGCTP
jgi:hypothetical protein